MIKVLDQKINPIIDLLNFQLEYLNQLMENIPDERLYEKQLEGFNSAGWIIGHLCLEPEDVIRELGIAESFKRLDENWEKWFKNSSGKIEVIDNLPNKEILMNTLNERYILLGRIYENLTLAQRNANHPSKLLSNVLTTFDAWFAHHLTTHIAMHCGNIVVWKKLIGIPVNGF